MAAPSGSNPRLKLKKPLDVWSTREKLCLASAVYKIGDQNWVSVSRSIKPYGEPNRPPDWFHQRNCLLQYYDLMEQLEQPKRKRGGDKSETDTPSLQIMRRMTIERSEQLKKEILEMQQTFKNLKNEVEEIKAGQWDDKIKDVWEEIEQEEKKRAEEQIKVEVKVEDDDDESKASADISEAATPLPDNDDSTQDSIGDISVLTDEEGAQPSGGSSFLTSTPVVTSTSSTEVNPKLSAPSELLSSLLKSDVKTATGLQQLKIEHEQVQQQQVAQHSLLTTSARSLLKTPVTQDDPLTTAPSSSKGTVQVTSSIKSTTAASSSDILSSSSSTAKPISVGDPLETVEETVVEDVIEDTSTDIPSVAPSQGSSAQREQEEDSNLTPVVEEVEEEVVGEEASEVKEEQTEAEEDQSNASAKDTEVEPASSVKDEGDKDSQDDEEEAVKSVGENLASEAELTESSVKDEPLSPTSSISSKMSETGSKRGTRGKVGRPRTAKSRMSTRKSYTTDDERKDDGGSSRHSDPELSEDDVREGEDILSGQMTSINASSILSESFPNSPASLSMCSDTEEEKSFKQWKKSIMLVWRAAATHKYANVFLHSVTDDIAPGYRSVVLRPMDLSTIKKNVETGVIRTTVEFQRDMMLMFTNAIMYNSSDHNVFKMAKEMYDDVMKHIEMMLQSSESKNLRQSRRADMSDKEDDVKRRRPSVDQPPETGGKSKKRKTRNDESLS